MTNDAWYRSPFVGSRLRKERQQDSVFPFASFNSHEVKYGTRWAYAHLCIEDRKPIYSCRWCHLSKLHPSATQGKTNSPHGGGFERNDVRTWEISSFFPAPWNSHSDDRAVIRSVLLRIYCALRRVSAGAHGLKKKKTKNLFLKCRSPQLLQSRPCESHRTAAEEREKKKENKKKTSTWNLIIVMKWLYFVNSTWKKFFV